MVADLLIIPAGFTKVFFLTAGIIAFAGLSAMGIVRWCLARLDDGITRGIMWLANLFIFALCVGWIDTLYHQPVGTNQPQTALYKHHK